MAEINDEFLRIALDLYSERRLARMPSESDPIDWTFSPRFEHRMQRLIRRARKKESALAPSIESPVIQSVRPVQLEQPTQPVRPAKPKLKKRLLLAAVILALLVSLMSVSAAREAIIGFFVEVFEKFSTVVFPSDPQTGAPDALPQNTDELQALLPTAVPEGFLLGKTEITDFFVRSIYANQAGEELIIEILLSEKFQMQIDSENVSVEEIQIGKGHALYYSNNGVQSLIWQHGSFAWIITGKITKEDTINIVNSINLS